MPPPFNTFPPFSALQLRSRSEVDRRRDRQRRATPKARPRLQDEVHTPTEEVISSTEPPSLHPPAPGADAADASGSASAAPLAPAPSAPAPLAPAPSAPAPSLPIITVFPPNIAGFPSAVLDVLSSDAVSRSMHQFALQRVTGHSMVNGMLRLQIDDGFSRMPQAAGRDWEYVIGLHATDEVGSLGIGSALQLLPGPASQDYGSIVCCRAFISETAPNVDLAGESLLAHCLKRTRGSSKHRQPLIWEMRAYGPKGVRQSVGVDYEVERDQVMIIHYNKDRTWSFPQQISQAKAIWIDLDKVV